MEITLRKLRHCGVSIAAKNKIQKNRNPLYLKDSGAPAKNRCDKI